jgi:hypothetical protein
LFDQQGMTAVDLLRPIIHCEPSRNNRKGCVMCDYYEKHDLKPEDVSDWFDQIESAGNGNSFTYSCHYHWFVKEKLTIKQIRALRPFAWSAYKTTGQEDSWNTNWDKA